MSAALHFNGCPKAQDVHRPLEPPPMEGVPLVLLPVDGRLAVAGIPPFCSSVVPGFSPLAFRPLEHRDRQDGHSGLVCTACWLMFRVSRCQCLPASRAEWSHRQGQLGSVSFNFGALVP